MKTSPFPARGAKAQGRKSAPTRNDQIAKAKIDKSRRPTVLEITNYYLVFIGIQADGTSRASYAIFERTCLQAACRYNHGTINVKSRLFFFSSLIFCASSPSVVTRHTLTHTQHTHTRIVVLQCAVCTVRHGRARHSATAFVDGARGQTRTSSKCLCNFLA